MKGSTRVVASLQLSPISFRVEVSVGKKVSSPRQSM